MIKNLLIQQQQQQQQQILLEENMSNLTSASGEASVSSGNRADNSNMYQPSFPPQTQNLPPVKKKRNLPGNPDPDAEVIALSPKALMATNRFMCEICNKGFQRDQNLQLHRRGHNLPWKLKQRTSKEVRKRVYICPEPSCVHHDPLRALGDLTGIKKHFCRKHGEKKWKCDKCSKRYAVQSDWKAHSKTCGTREYRCDCGTLFSRRDSFITHRAFCDALAEESAKAFTTNPLSNPLQSTQVSSSALHTTLQAQFPQLNSNGMHALSLKRDPLQSQQQQQGLSLRPHMSSWPSYPSAVGAGPGPPSQPPAALSHLELPSSIFSARFDHEFSHSHDNPSVFPQSSSSSPHMSATALLQKAAQMGATMSKPAPPSSSMQGPHVGHVSAASTANSAAAGFGLELCSHEDTGSSFGHGLTAAFGNKAAVFMNQTATAPSLLHNIMSSFSSSDGFDHRCFEQDEALHGAMLSSKRETTAAATSLGTENLPKSYSRSEEGGVGGGGSDGLTRDFLGPRAFSHRDILNLAGFETCMNSNFYEQTQNQKPW